MPTINGYKRLVGGEVLVCFFPCSPLLIWVPHSRSGHPIPSRTAMILARLPFGLYHPLQSLHPRRASRSEYQVQTCELPTIIVTSLDAIPRIRRNPYFAISAIFLLGLRGIAKQTPLNTPPISQLGNDRSKAVRLSASLEDATRKMMRPGSIAREVFGDEFVDHYGGTREHEVKLWNEAVTNWEGEITLYLLLLLAYVLIHSGTLS